MLITILPRLGIIQNIGINIHDWGMIIWMIKYKIIFSTSFCIEVTSHQDVAFLAIGGNFFFQFLENFIVKISGVYRVKGRGIGETEVYIPFKIKKCFKDFHPYSICITALYDSYPILNLFFN